MTLDGAPVGLITGGARGIGAAIAARLAEVRERIAAAARAAGRKVSITLSDSFCVDRYRDEFRALLRDKVDILFANEAEITSLYEVKTFEEAMEAVRKEARIAVLTRSEKGSVVVKGGETHAVAAAPVASTNAAIKRSKLPLKTIRESFSCWLVPFKSSAVASSRAP